jgi:Bacterial Ig domain/Domain of unknown function DUF11
MRSLRMLTVVCATLAACFAAPSLAAANPNHYTTAGGTVKLRISDWFYGFWTGLGGTFTPAGNAKQLASDPQTFLMKVTAGSSTQPWAADSSSGVTLNYDGAANSVTGLSETRDGQSLRSLGIFDTWANGENGLCQQSGELLLLEYDPNPDLGHFPFMFASHGTDQAINDYEDCLITTGFFPVADSVMRNEFSKVFHTADLDIWTYDLIDPPVARGDSASTVPGQPVTINVLGNDDPPLGDPFTPQITQQPANGTLKINAGGTITYTPNPGFHGPDTFAYQDDNGTSTSNTATVAITVGQPSADVRISITGASKAAAGSTFSETVNVANAGPSPATAVLSGLTVPSGVSVVNTGGGRLVGGIVTWNDPTLAASASLTHAVTFKVNPHTSRTVLVGGSAASLKVKDPNYANNVAAVAVRLG